MIANQYYISYRELNKFSKLTKEKIGNVYFFNFAHTQQTNSKHDLLKLAWGFKNRRKLGLQNETNVIKKKILVNAIIF